MFLHISKVHPHPQTSRMIFNHQRGFKPQEIQEKAPKMLEIEVIMHLQHLPWWCKLLKLLKLWFKILKTQIWRGWMADFLERKERKWENSFSERI